VGIILLGYIICLLTVWTSPSLWLGSASVPTLSPNLSQWCHKAKSLAKECDQKAKTMTTEAGVTTEKESSSSSTSSSSSICQSHHEVSRQCENVVQKAYRKINLGGCTWEIKSSYACEEEWCHSISSPSSSSSSCQTECQGVRDSLNTCIQKVVTNYFQSYGFEKDGTRITKNKKV